MSFLSPKPPKPQPVVLPDPPPTIDQASQAAEESNRLRRRKGRNKYLFGGMEPGPTPVGSKVLTGQ